MRTAARALLTGSDVDRVLAIQVGQDALDAAKADCLDAIDATKAYEVDGASTLNTWVRNELRLSGKDAAQLVRASATLGQLPLVAQAATAGAIRADHVAVFTYGLKHIGAEVIRSSQDWLLDVATSNEPGKLFEVVRALREALFPRRARPGLDGRHGQARHPRRSRPRRLACDGVLERDLWDEAQDGPRLRFRAA